MTMDGSKKGAETFLGRDAGLVWGQGPEVLQLSQVPKLDAIGSCGGQVVAIFAETKPRDRALVSLKFGHILHRAHAADQPQAQGR